MMTILRWALNAGALMLLPEIVTAIQVRSLTAALVAAIVIGLLNTLIRPLLLLLTLPITVLTLGLFILVINALLFWVASGLVKGFFVPDFWAAMLGALVYSILTWLVDLALGDKQAHMRRR
ncbi:phage holin family protein [Uliginosibacterium flavum]|uniref:Phage holin family protein n=1 Tax=Uliginosibacterium flavum TaxID=1396831 RepID=A0ABV2TJJ6_9RHOO